MRCWGQHLAVRGLYTRIVLLQAQVSNTSSTQDNVVGARSDAQRRVDQQGSPSDRPIEFETGAAESIAGVGETTERRGLDVKHDRTAGAPDIRRHPSV